MPEIPSFAPLVHTLYEDDALIAVQKPAPLQCHLSPSAPREAIRWKGAFRVYLGAPAQILLIDSTRNNRRRPFAKLPFVQCDIQRQMAEAIIP